MKKPKQKVSRSPAVIIVGSMLLLFGIALFVLGIMSFSPSHWIASCLIMLSGFTTGGLAVMALVTGKPEWILFNLMLPG